MRKKILVWGCLILTSCGLYTKNHREIKFAPSAQKEVRLLLYELEYPLTDKSLQVYGNEYSLKGKDCEDGEMKNFGGEILSEIVKQNDLSTIKSINIHLFKEFIDVSRPKYCEYVYVKKDGGEWSLK